MKILIVTNLYAPDVCGGAAQCTDLAQGFAERGHEVDVFTAHPYYPEWKNKTKANVWRVKKESYPRLNIYRHGMYLPKNTTSFMSRITVEVFFLLSLLRSLFRGKRADLVLVYCPLFGSLMFSLLRKFFRREKVWLNIQDIPTDAARAAGISKSGFLHRFAEWVQKTAFSLTDFRSTISPEMQKRIEEIVGPRHKVELCPNWLVGPIAKRITDQGHSRPKENSKKLRLLYCGNIGQKQGLPQLCQQLSNTSIPFRFTIRGSGSGCKQLQDWLDQSKDPRFTLSNLLPDQEFIDAVKSADAFVCCEKPSSGFAFIPSKIIPSISLGTPLLAISDVGSPLGQEVITNGLGLHIDWNSISSLESKLPGFIQRRNQYSENCLKRADYYCRDTCLNRYEKLGQRVAAL